MIFAAKKLTIYSLKYMYFVCNGVVSVRLSSCSIYMQCVSFQLCRFAVNYCILFCNRKLE